MLIFVHFSLCVTHRLLKFFPSSDAFKLPELFTFHTPGNHSLKIHRMTLVQPAEKVHLLHIKGVIYYRKQDLA